jgi:hypothetical protein
MFSGLRAKSGLRVKKLTTYLGTLLPNDIYEQEYNGKSLVKSLTDANYKKLVGQYEAVLTQASYMSRLAYEINPSIIGGLQLINFNPVVFNTGLSMIRKNFSRFSSDISSKSVNRLFLTPNGTVSLPTGAAFIDNGVSIYRKAGLTETPVFVQCVDYRSMQSGCPIPGKKVLYISFRGTMSIKSGLTDVKGASKSIDSLCTTCKMEGISGSTAIDTYKQEAEKYRKTAAVNPFGAHYGFVENMIPVMNDVCKAVENMTSDGSIDKIIITGHSLGGANAALAALVLAAFKKHGIKCLQKPAIHCITFGAPKLFTDFSRNVFNSLLDGGVLTLDRIANRAKNIAIAALSVGTAINIVPTIPGWFVHPGYMILKTEIKTQSRTGRSKNITDIRQMFGGIEPGSGLFFTDFNGLPTYKEFLDCFTRLEAMDDATYKSNIMNLPLGTLYFGLKGKSYNEIKDTVTYILGRAPPDTSQTEEVDAAKKGENEVPLPPADLSGEEAGSAGASPQSGGLLPGGPLTEEYKKNTVERGPNHVVYNCQKNLTIWSCHMAYLGVSYHGGFKNISHSKTPIEDFVVDEIKLTIKTRAEGGRRRKTYRQIKKRRSYTRRA